MSRIPVAAAPCVVLIAAPATAHVTFDPPQAAPRAYVRAALRVPHGCGDAATTRITVALTDGEAVARPMPKPGRSVVLTPRADAPARGCRITRRWPPPRA